MKIIQVTLASKKTETGEPQKAHLVIGPGVFWTKAENNLATAISATSGVILVLETEEQIAEAIRNQGVK